MGKVLRFLKPSTEKMIHEGGLIVQDSIADVIARHRGALYVDDIPPIIMRGIYYSYYTMAARGEWNNGITKKVIHEEIDFLKELFDDNFERLKEHCDAIWDESHGN